MIAIRDKDGIVSYEALSKVTGNLAQRLTDIAGSGRVCLILPHNRFYPIAVVATLRAGMAFCPIVSDCPDDRVADILLEVLPSAVITTSNEYKKRKTLLVGTRVILIDRIDLDAPCAFSDSHVASESDAMIIYTSGSKGVPKGVVHTRKSLLANTRFKLFPRGQTIFKIASVLDFAFFASNIDMIACLLNRGEIHIIDKSVSLDIPAFAEYLSRNNITRLVTTPQIAAMLSRLDNPGPQMIVIGGSRPCGICTGGRTIYGMGYGSTESGCSTTCFLDDATDPSDIGLPYDDVEVHILDEDMTELPNGTEGEICISSPRIARGYFADAALTAERFVASPFCDGEVLYRSGDIGIRCTDGSIILNGRLDRMLKHNAYRIHPEEVERRAEMVDGVCSATLLNSSGVLQLYYEGVADEDALMRHLRSALPAYMVPARIIRLDRMPVTGFGKADHKILESMGEDVFEDRILQAMRQVLKISTIRVDEDFFSLGGDSVGVMELTYMLQDLPLSVADIHRGRSASGVATIIRQKCRSCQDLEQTIVWPESVPLVQFQRYVLGVCETSSCKTMWNTPILLKLKEPCDPHELAKAIECVICAHPLLSYRYDHASQMMRREQRLKPRVCLTAIGATSPASFAASLIREFDIHEAPLYRVHIIESAEGVHLLLDFHHLIADGASIVLFVNQIWQALSGKKLRVDRFCEYAQSHATAVGKPVSGFEVEMGVCEAKMAQFPVTGRDLTELGERAAAKAVAKSAGDNEPKVSWLCHNRYDERYSDSFGPMLSKRTVNGVCDFSLNDGWHIEINNLCILSSIQGFTFVQMSTPGLLPDPGTIAMLLIPDGRDLCIRMEYNSCCLCRSDAERLFDAFVAEFDNPSILQ